MRIVITGAAGQIGRQLAEELTGEHDLFLLDRHRIKERASMVANLAKNRVRSLRKLWSIEHLPRWMKSFEGADVVIHLAEEPDSEANWQRICDNNLRATWNVLQAAVEHRVRRVIYASSGWVVKSHELQLAPDCYKPDGPKIDSAAFPRPKNPYGVAKAIGEMTGRSLVDEGKLASFVALRLGWFIPNPPKHESYRKHGINVRDLRSLFRRCVEADFRGFHIVYGVSAQRCAPYDLSHTRELLAWEPAEIPE